MARRHVIRDSIHIRNQAWNLRDPPEGMKPIERKWICEETDVDITSIKGSTCQKIVYDKVQGVDYDKIGYSVAIFKSVQIMAKYLCLQESKWER